MSSYSDNRSQKPLAAFKPRPWKEETALNLPIYSRPEPISKTNIPSKNSFTQSFNQREEQAATELSF